MNNVQKKYFIGLTHFLGSVLGPKYEVVFHSFDKKTQKTPVREIDIAIREMNDWSSRYGH